MRPLRTDLSIFKKFNFEKPPVGIKYEFQKPEGIEQLDKSLALCEMLKEAHQRGTPFYFTEENENCAGKTALGMMETTPIAESGQVGAKDGIFQEPRANSNLLRNLFQNFPRLGKGVVNYVAYSPLDKLTFEPDLLVLMATAGQAEIVLRAMSYSTGELWKTLATPAFACASLYVYPYQSGKVNYMVTGMSFGMKAKEVFPEGWLLISIPYHWIPTITQNLREMQWVLPAYTDGREKFMQRSKQIMGELTRESQNS
jgi:uncharacterized protein (DUF169 family)